MEAVLVLTFWLGAVVTGGMAGLAAADTRPIVILPFTVLAAVAALMTVSVFLAFQGVEAE